MNEVARAAAVNVTDHGNAGLLGRSQQFEHGADVALLRLSLQPVGEGDDERAVEEAPPPASRRRRRRRQLLHRRAQGFDLKLESAQVDLLFRNHAVVAEFDCQVFGREDFEAGVFDVAPVTGVPVLEPGDLHRRDRDAEIVVGSDLAAVNGEGRMIEQRVEGPLPRLLMVLPLVRETRRAAPQPRRIPPWAKPPAFRRSPTFASIHCDGSIAIRSSAS